MRNKTIGYLQIILIIISVFAFSYIFGQYGDYFDGVNDNYKVRVEDGMGIDEAIEDVGNLLFGFVSEWLKRSRIGFVSAQQGLWTCLENVNGTICQEYPSENCNEQCTTECFPGRRENFGECRLGTCYSAGSGECQANTPKAACEISGGEWSLEEPAQCSVECCLINPHGDGFADETRYTTEQSCNYIGQTQNIRVEWVPVEGEVACLLKAGAQEEGACVLEEIIEEGKFNCKFTSKPDCLNLGGDFYKDKLCSNPELNTICERQESVSCTEGNDEVYWYDSCGNKENIYDSNKGRSWNNGKVLSKANSCELGDNNNPVKNQNSCGNCNYLLGSVCGEWESGEKHIIHDELGDFVCLDLSCTDENGQTRTNGESWCAFDSQIGLDSGRSVDVPGSSHYRKVCIDGKIETEVCSEFRNEVCVENRDEKADFSSSACRINQWQLCIEANTDEASLGQCETHTDCSLNNVNVDDYFKFDLCTPKYPPGFDLDAERGGDVAKSICSQASMTCTMIEVKDFRGKWKCKANCDCKDSKFSEEMNNLCMSLGDCGASVNVEGTFSDEGYRVKKADRLSSSYINGLKQYAEPKKGQSAEQLSGAELDALFGLDKADLNYDDKLLTTLGTISGLGGIALAWAIKSGYITGTVAISEAVAFQMSNVAGIEASTIASPGLAGAAGAAAGALVGAAIVSWIIKLGGFGPGLPDGFVYVLVLGGAFSGGLIGASFFFDIPLGLTIAGWVVGILVISYLIFAWLSGVGKTREIKVDFSCLPWQPPAGGADCSKCGADGLPCTRYKCNSLGKSCELVNEGSEEVECIDVSPNDVSAPIISPDESALKEGFRYVESSNGVKIESDSEDGCIKEYGAVNFGIKLSEHGQCKLEDESTRSYSQMSEYFEDNLYKEKHKTAKAMPSLSSLGVPGIGPDRRGEHRLYARCQDAAGNSNTQEYAVDFCVSPADDKTPPVINKFIPNPGYAGLNATEIQVQFYTNEPAECRWSLEDKEYDVMENLASCANEIEDIRLDGWLCNTNLSVTEQREKDYYFRCLDQPWLSQDEDPDNDDDRNANTESIIYKVIKTVQELVISSVSPDGERIVNGTGSNTVSVDIKLETSGGINGEAICEFSSNGEYFIKFFDTGGARHKQTLSSLPEGDYDFRLMCKDLAGNIATGNSVFSIELDGEGPIITRAYQQSGNLIVITNERAECVYDFNSCGFNFENGTLMSGSDFIHTSRFERGNVYHVKCEDIYGNRGSCLRFTGGY